MKNLLSFLFLQSKAFREIVNKCEVLMAMCSILNRCKCLSTLTEPFPNKLQLHDCLLVKYMWDFKQHVNEKLHPQLRKPLHYLLFSPSETDLHIWELWRVTIFGLLLLENAINSGSEFLWKMPVSFQLQQCSSWSSSVECVFFRVVVEGSPGFWSECQPYAFVLVILGNKNGRSFFEPFWQSQEAIHCSCMLSLSHISKSTACWRLLAELNPWKGSPALLSRIESSAVQAICSCKLGI